MHECDTRTHADPGWMTAKQLVQREFRKQLPRAGVTRRGQYIDPWATCTTTLRETNVHFILDLFAEVPDNSR